ncbi:MAG: hypothetical protein H6592_00870 [Flavobacteriales bacterium]|nr:hypothetical protein [Flavobacteriales bacterium]HPF89890.1 hypothetical protein [Flavobacteriales bacterium]
MNEQATIGQRTLAWLSWTIGSLVLAFLLFMLVGHLTGDANGPEGMRFTSTMDLVGFLLFPVSTILGLLVAYRTPLVGGLIAMIGILVLLCLRPDLLVPEFLWLLAPGLLYAIRGWLLRR